MAFVNGFITRYECPLCGIGCRSVLKSKKTKTTSFKFVYEHIDNIIFVNGYPSPCKNNGKILSTLDVNKINSPNIVSAGQGKY